MINIQQQFYVLFDEKHTQTVGGVMFDHHCVGMYYGTREMAPRIFKKGYRELLVRYPGSMIQGYRRGYQKVPGHVLRLFDTGSFAAVAMHPVPTDRRVLTLWNDSWGSVVVMPGRIAAKFDFVIGWAELPSKPGWMKKGK